MVYKRTLVKSFSLSIFLLLALTPCAVPVSVETSAPAAEPTEVGEVALQEPTQPALQFTNRAVQIADVQVEVGVGSPIPVEAVAAGTWPDLCAQIEQINQSVTEFRFDIEILASGADPNCPPDSVGLAFRMAIPLNMTSLPSGTYTVSINGVETSFDWPAESPEAMPIENMGLKLAYRGRAMVAPLLAEAKAHDRATLAAFPAKDVAALKTILRTLGARATARAKSRRRAD